jgi:tetratricopeptide (TPR) repeat protein
LTDTPVISWNAVPKTQQYTVRVTDSQGIIWEQQTEKSSIIYSGQPALVPGIPYSVKIQGDRGQSSEQDNSSKLEFVKLHPTEIQTIKAEVSKIEQLKLNAQTTALTLANLYGTYTLPASMGKNYSLSASTRPTYHLTSDAIAVLEAVIQQGKTSPLIERTLGDLYWQTGLVNLATEHYLKTIKLAQTPETLEELTLAQFGLGEIASATDHSADAKLWYSKAREGYLSLGDSQQADFLQRLIESL